MRREGEDGSGMRRGRRKWHEERKGRRKWHEEGRRSIKQERLTHEVGKKGNNDQGK